MNIFDVRFSKVHFCLQVVEDTVMPKDKTSGFRGGIGEMLLRMNCIENRDCDSCRFAEECLVQKVMYAKCVIPPKSVNVGESFGYVFDCENQKTEFYAGDEISLTLTLFGKSILYFQLYLHALAMLGNEGIGKNKSRFVITSVTNMHNEPILDQGTVRMDRYKYETLEEYVSYRWKQIGESDELVVVFKSPATIKYMGEVLETFNLEAVYKAAARRLYMLDCFEGIEYDEMIGSLSMPYEMVSQKVYSENVQRFSNHKMQKMKLTGIKGSLILRELDGVDYKELFTKVLLAGEILHIGKNTSFGFGKYIIKINK